MYYLSSEESGLYDIGFDIIRIVSADNVRVPRDTTESKVSICQLPSIWRLEYGFSEARGWNDISVNYSRFVQGLFYSHWYSGLLWLLGLYYP